MQKQKKVLIFITFIFAVFITSLAMPTKTKAFCIICSNEDETYEKEQQFVERIKIIKSALGDSIDEITLAATVLHKRSALEVIESEYDEDWNSSEETAYWGNLKKDRATYTNSESAGGASRDVSEEEVDLLNAAAIVMADSAGWTGSYNEEKYKEALAGTRLIGNNVDKSDSFGQGLSDFNNWLFCGIGFGADAIFSFGNFTFQLATGQDVIHEAERTSTRWANMKKICDNGYIGGVYETALKLDDEDQRQAYKDKTAQEIIDLANYYKQIRGNISATNSEGAVCYYKIRGIDEEVSNVKVQTLRCEYGNDKGSVGDPIDGEEPVDLDSVYIPGVVYGEVGAESNPETQKAQAVYARSYGLTRGGEMNGAYGIGLSIKNGQWILSLRNCTSDQAYCNLDKGCGTLSGGTPQGSTSGGPTLYSGGKGTGLYKPAVAEDAPIRQAVAETKGQVVVDDEGYVKYTPFASNQQNEWASRADSGTKYLDIVKSTANAEVKSDCRGGVGNYDFESYYQASANAPESTSDNINDDLANTPLQNSGAFSSHIKSKVNEAGYGTREAVVAAGVALVGDFIMSTDKRLRYNQASWYGNRHPRQSSEVDGIVNDNFTLDCSGFAWWALYNGGFKLPSYPQTGSQKGWAQSNGYIKSVDAGKPGDFLISDGHIVLIIGTYDGGYYTAEFLNWGKGALINKYGTGGFSTSGYQVIDMDAYYNNASNKR